MKTVIETVMKTDIIKHLDNPRQLEKMYRDNTTLFKNAFNALYPEIREETTAQFWKERLSFETEEISWGSTIDLMFITIAAFIAGLVAKIPDFAGIDHNYFYPRNIAFVVFPFLIAYFAWKQQVPTKKLIIAAIAIIVSAGYINFLPDDTKSDTLILACIHLPLFLWVLLGFTFVGANFSNLQRRLDFLRFNGDLAVMTAIIVIACGLLTGITFGLFELIGINIEEIYSKYIAVWGAASVPLVATYLVRSNPQLVNKVSPIIARIFTPLVLVMLVIYLGAVLYTGKDPYNDREFLLIFNLLLIGVMAIILFSAAEISKDTENKIGTLLLLSLSIVTVIVNGIALSAILFRISEWGVTPNRLAVLGGNILILINLLIVSFRLFKSVKDRNEMGKVECSIAAFLPVYAIWTIIVVFFFPVIFSFK